jgi:hypothetical protein
LYYIAYTNKIGVIFFYFIKKRETKYFFLDMASVHPVYDKRTLTQILARQGITFPSDFLENPKRSDTFSFFKLLLYLVLGFDVSLNSKEELRVFLTEHKLKVSRGTLKSHLPVGMFVKDLFLKHI